MISIKSVVNIDVFTTCQKYFNNEEKIEIEIERGSTIEELLSTLSLKYPDLVPIINDLTDEKIRRFFMITIDGKIAKIKDTINENQCNMRLVPPIFGG